MTQHEQAAEYAAIRGWTVRAFMPHGVAFDAADGTDAGLLMWAALPEELRWHRAQAAAKLRAGLERMRVEARFMVASGRRVSARRLEREIGKLLGTA